MFSELEGTLKIMAGYDRNNIDIDTYMVSWELASGKFRVFLNQGVMYLEVTNKETRYSHKLVVEDSQVKLKRWLQDVINMGKEDELYQVKEGDTLYSIAKEHRITMSSLVSANKEVLDRYSFLHDYKRIKLKIPRNG